MKEFFNTDCLSFPDFQVFVGLTLARYRRNPKSVQESQQFFCSDNKIMRREEIMSIVYTREEDSRELDLTLDPRPLLKKERDWWAYSATCFVDNNVIEDVFEDGLKSCVFEHLEARPSQTLSVGLFDYGTDAAGHCLLEVRYCVSLANPCWLTWQSFWFPSPPLNPLFVVHTPQPQLHSVLSFLIVNEPSDASRDDKPVKSIGLAKGRVHPYLHPQTSRASSTPALLQ